MRQRKISRSTFVIKYGENLKERKKSDAKMMTMETREKAAITEYLSQVFAASSNG